MLGASSRDLRSNTIGDACPGSACRRTGVRDRQLLPLRSSPASEVDKREAVARILGGDRHRRAVEDRGGDAFVEAR